MFRGYVARVDVPVGNALLSQTCNTDDDESTRFASRITDSGAASWRVPSLFLFACVLTSAPGVLYSA
eukprot:4685825-Amphidinium_carterae.1